VVSLERRPCGALSQRSGHVVSLRIGRDVGRPGASGVCAV
jgi:hypothetical protein